MKTRQLLATMALWMGALACQAAPVIDQEVESDAPRQARNAGTGYFLSPSSLYERVGGLRVIAPMVDNFVERLIASFKMNGSLPDRKGRQTASPAYLKFQLSQLLCEMSGGPCTYSGMPLKEAHLPMHLSGKDWELMNADFKRSMDQYRIPAAEQDELFALLDETRVDIISHPGSSDGDND